MEIALGVLVAVIIIYLLGRKGNKKKPTELPRPQNVTSTLQSKPPVHHKPAQPANSVPSPAPPRNSIAHPSYQGEYINLGGAYQRAEALCSDNNCPCPQVIIPRNEGYIYVEKYPNGNFTANVTCEQGARLRNLDLKVAHADAKYWWQTGMVPRRETPKNNSHQVAPYTSVISSERQKEINAERATAFLSQLQALAALAPKIEEEKPQIITSVPPVVIQQVIDKKKADWEKFNAILIKNNIKKLYHFTDRANIPSIKTNGGLHSWWGADSKGIAIAKPGGIGFGRDLDKYYNLEDFVRLSFTKNHPMMYIANKEGRIPHPVVLEIDPQVVYLLETKFSDMNATKTGHNCGPNLSDLEKIRFNVVKQDNHFNLSDEEKPYYQAEILVKSLVPAEMILNLQNF